MKQTVPTPEEFPGYIKIIGFLFEGSVKIRHEALERKDISVAAIEDGFLTYSYVLEIGFPQHNDALIAVEVLSELLADPDTKEWDIELALEEYVDIDFKIFNLDQYIKNLPLLNRLLEGTDPDFIVDEVLKERLAKVIGTDVEVFRSRIGALVTKIRTAIDSDINATLKKLNDVAQSKTEGTEA
jgi:hypothetical protein